MADKYKDMITMLPVSHVTGDDIEENLKKELNGLTELWYKVVFINTNNHCTFQSWHNSLGYDSSHAEYILNPFSEGEERFYTLYDTVDIFKNLFYGLLRNRNLTVPPFSGSGIRNSFFL